MPRQPIYKKGVVHRFNVFGCNCFSSGGCMTNYCPCYKYKSICSSYCTCKGCRNLEDRPEHEIDKSNGEIIICDKNNRSSVLVTPRKQIDEETFKIILDMLANMPTVKKIQHKNE